ncbi:MAG: NAD(P)/FAD-dependent oxidoreductase [Ferruginibacter sp.]|nr:NAD(P)/FAD-dependent oxidoreductase [Ferruginibacter sp.]
MSKKTLVIVGGGAAGFFCAVNAAAVNPAAQVIIVEKSGKLLSKVKVSGGGRCNVTHSCFSIAEMIRKYPRGGAFLKKAFHHFFTTDTIDWFLQRGVTLKTETDGRMFPVTNDSQTIIDCLMREVNKLNIEILLHRDVADVFFGENKWTLQFSNGTSLVADRLCIASGGYPRPGQFDWLRRTGHPIADPVPSLFTFNMPGNEITKLMGVTVDQVAVKIVGSKLTEQGPLLITHWGLSGPAILKLSAWGARELAQLNWHFEVVVNWLPEFNEQTLKEKLQRVRFDLAAQKIVNRNPFGLPQRLWEYLLQQSGVHEDLRWADLPAKEQNKLIKNICMQQFQIKGKTTFKEEFVTAGGVALETIDHNTMQSKIAPGLYFAGEVLNIDGVTGGFNFQSAWTTGWIAAQAMAAD